MATYSRRSRYSRSSRSRYRSRWLRNKYVNKRYKRARRRQYRKKRYRKKLNKKEVKFVQSERKWFSTQPGNHNPVQDGQVVQDRVIFYNQCHFAIGYRPGDWHHYWVDNVEEGTGFNERVGQYINVLKYEVKGTFTLSAMHNRMTNQYENAPYPDYQNTTMMNGYQGWIVKVIMFQVKNGNLTCRIGDNAYHEFAPELKTYLGNTFPARENPTKLLPDYLPGNEAGDFQTYYFSYEELVKNSRVSSMNFMGGITKAIKILKHKTYYVTPDKSIRNFKISTKKIGRLQWGHTRYQPPSDDIINQQLRDAIFTSFYFTPIAFMKDLIPAISMSAVQRISFVDP